MIRLTKESFAAMMRDHSDYMQERRFEEEKDLEVIEFAFVAGWLARNENR